MRKIFNSLFVVTALLSLSMLSSCSDDDKLAKSITIDGEKFTLSHGVIQGLDVDLDDNDDLVSVYAVALATSGVTFDDGLEGSGTAILMQLISPTSLRLENGTYTIEVGENFLKSKAFSIVLKNLDSEAEEVETQYQAVSGTIKISRSGSTYKITFNMVMTDGEDEVTVKGSYEGKLTETLFFGGNA